MSTKSPPTPLKYCAQSDCGLVRRSNEDAWGVTHAKREFVLADGMGGHVCGDLAANLAVAAFIRLVEKGMEIGDRSTDVKKKLLSLIHSINQDVYEKSLTNPELKGMGTTFVSAFFLEDSVVFGHVGDSRIYRYRNNRLQQLTNDHSPFAEKKGKEGRSYSPMATGRYRHMITQAIGVRSKISPSIGACSWQEGDLFLMCSDGLSDHLSHRTIEKIFQMNKTIEQTTDAMIKSANSLGGTDNTTVIIIQP